jgi:aryl-alcohol dehydrogenase-like predicted oxidoreductase
MEKGDLTRREFVQYSAAVTAGLASGVASAKEAEVDTSKILNYNKDMDYRRLGKTELMVSAVCLGGHWKRIEKMVPGVLEKEPEWLSADLENPGFKENRRAVVDHCMEVGINYIDACTREEILAYGEALRGRQEKMYLGFSWYQEEMRKKDFRTAKALLGTLEKGMSEAKLDYVDLWRITLLSKSGEHTEGELEEMVQALAKAKEQGKARFTGVSSHDRPHIKQMIETYPDDMQVVVTPYTASTTELPEDSLFEAVKKHDVGLFGIKPFASNSLFEGDSSTDSPHAEEDDRRARLAIRYILHNPAVTAPIPGMINTHQVDNVAAAIKERRKLSLAEAEELSKAMTQAWAKLPDDYEWLRDWQCV